MRRNRVLSVALGALVVVATARVCAAEPQREYRTQLVQAIPASQLSQIRGTGVSVAIPVEPVARVRLWDELRRSGTATTAPQGYSMGTLTITVGPSGSR